MDIQKTDLLALCKRRGWAVQRVYEDKGVSGGKDSRPALDEMLKEVRRGKVDVVAVWRFDRFGRSTAHLVTALNEFESLGVDFVSLNEALDTSTPAGRMLFSVIAAMAEFERTIIHERVRAGIGAAKRRGVQLGRPRKAFDYRRASAMRKAGVSYRKIARDLDVSLATLWRHLGPD